MAAADSKNLVRVLAHDLANPLTVIDFRLKRLLKLDLSAEANDSLEKIHHAVAHMVEIIENVRAVESAVAKRWVANPKSCSLHDIVGNLNDEFELYLKDKNLTLDYNSEDLNHLQITTDPDIVRTRIIGPIISNAIKFSNANSKISLTTGHVPGGVVLSIKDDGVGMDEKTLSLVFNEDERILHEGTANEKGSGLGLLVCSAFAKFLKIKVEVFSAPNEGTLVQVAIPKHWVD